MNNLVFFLVFIAIVLTIYGGVNYYLYRKVIDAVNPTGWARHTLRVVLLLLILAFPLGHALNPAKILGTVFIWIGSFWLAVMLYGLLIGLTVDLLRLSDSLIGWFPRWILIDRIQMSRLTVVVSTIVILMLLTCGYIRASNPLSREVEVALDKFPPGFDEYRISVIADLHLGTLVGEKRLSRIVEAVNFQGSDLVLIIGDLIDENPKRLSWAEEPLKKIESVDGVYCVTGNHEFYGGLDEFLELVKASNINVLRNQFVQIEDRFSIVGLDDVTGARQFAKKQPSISKVLEGIEKKLPVILMHHTPTRIKEAQEYGVDLMLCGHTHGGQLWPVGIVVKWIFGVKQGLNRFDDMQLFQTNGAGTWGPPVRIGASPEIVQLILRPSSVDKDNAVDD